MMFSLHSDCFVSPVFLFQLEGKVQQGERDFEQISKTIRKELVRFEVSEGVGVLFWWFGLRCIVVGQYNH